MTSKHPESEQLGHEVGGDGEPLRPTCRTRARVIGSRYFTTWKSDATEDKRSAGVESKQETMEATAHADRRELARLPEVLAVCSSAGWTDQKHTLYLSLLQESFVNQLQDGEISFNGLFSLSPRRPSSRPKQSSKVDTAKSCRKVEQIRSPCCDHQEDGQVYSTDDDDASAAETIQESSGSQSSATRPGQSSTSHFGDRKHSPSRTAEGSDQNFIDEDTEGNGESRRRRSNKRLKSADNTMDDQARERRCTQEDTITASELPPV